MTTLGDAKAVLHSIPATFTQQRGTPNGGTAYLISWDCDCGNTNELHELVYANDNIECPFCGRKSIIKFVGMVLMRRDQ